MSKAQDNGIKWMEGLSWEQVKAKAKEENKYIFIDVFATWCVPCKKMDKEVYTNDTLINYFNENFISVKVQLDKTKTDNAFVQSWYNDAEVLIKQHRVMTLPSFLFFSPGAVVVHKAFSYKSVSELMNEARIAVKPGQLYNDPYAKYDTMVADYKHGIKNYEKMPYMIQTAFLLGEADLGKQILDEHTEYVAGRSKAVRYTPENIEMWSNFVLGTKRKRFWFFYNDGEYIDKVMNKKGYARTIVNTTIEHEIVWPFFKEQTANASIKMNLETMGLFDPQQKPDYSEADWKNLYKRIRKKFSRHYATSNVLEAKIKWYDRHKNYNASILVWLEKFKNNPPDITALNTPGTINNLGWNTFLNVTDKKLLNRMIYWVEKAIQAWPDTSIGSAILDTYANLLYKTGRKEEAITWEAKALKVAEYNKHLRSVAAYKIIIEKMRKDEPTYLEKGAVWLKREDGK